MIINSLKSDVLFSGYYGQSNVGDDAFVEVASWGAKKYWSMPNNLFLAPTDKLPEVVTNVRGYPLAISNTYRFQRRFLLPFTNHVISAGGSTLCREFLPNDIKSMAIKRKHKRQDLKVGGIGVSVGPFKTLKDEKFIVNYLKQLDFLAVRDRASYEIVSSLDLPYRPVSAFDLAALLPNIYRTAFYPKRARERKVVGVSVCPYESIVDRTSLSREKERNSKVVELLERLDRAENIHMKFFIFNGNSKVGDLNLTKETIDRVRPSSFEIVPYTRETRLVWEEISNCDFMISTRLHAAIFSCFSNTPFMLNEYHRKCGDFLDDVGQDESYRLFNSEYNPDDKAEIILSTLNGDYTPRSPLFMKQMIEKAEMNFTEVGL